MPYAPDRREYRYFTLGLGPYTSDDADSAFVVEGYATTFDVPYDMGAGHFERIDPHALDSADLSDVIMQMNHEGSPVARLRNRTLALKVDDHGLLVRAYLGGTERGRQLYEEIASGYVDRMSWGFTVDDGGWEYDPNTRTSTVMRVQKVYDVSAVSIPADPDTEIHARSYLDGVIEAEHEEFVARDRERRARAAAALSLSRL